MTPPPAPQEPSLAHLTECQAYDEEEYPYCNDRAEPCRFKNRKNCPDYKSVIHHQVECDVRQGTTFAQQMVSDAIGEPIYVRPHHTPATQAQPEKAIFQIEPNSNNYTISEIVEINEFVRKAKEQAKAEERERIAKLFDCRREYQDGFGVRFYLMPISVVDQFIRTPTPTNTGSEDKK